MPKKSIYNKKKSVSSENELFVEIDKVIADFEITSSILGKLQMDIEFPDYEVSVSTKNGCVTLSGNLRWDYQKSMVASMLKNMNGVKEIRNMISVSPELTSSSLSSSFSAN